MTVSCTIFKILSQISQNLKRSRDHDHAHYGIGGHPKTADFILYSLHAYKIRRL